MRLLRTAIVALLGLGVLASCGLKSGANDGELGPFACTGDGDCPVGDYCESSLGACLPEVGGLTRAVAVSLTPPPGSGYTVTQYAEWAVSDDGELPTLHLPEPSVVYGWVRPSGNELEDSVEATVTARADGDIPGTEYQFSSSTLDETNVTTGAGYELLLTPTDAAYQFTVVPDNEDYPAYRLTPRRFGQSALRYDVEIPAYPDDYLTLTGRVLYLIDGQPAPLGGVGVRAVGLISGNTSTEGVTGADGRFAFLLPPVDDELWAVSTLTLSDSEQAIPKATLLHRIEGDETSYVEAVEVADGDDLGDLWYGALPGRSAVTLTVRGTQGEPVANVDVQCEGEVARGERPDGGEAESARIRAARTTDDAGHVTLDVRRGSYACTAQPEAASGLAAGKLSFEAAGASVAQEISLVALLPVEGRIMDHSGTRAVRDASVLLLPMEEGTLSAGRQFSAATDAEGRFTLWVDPGDYAFVVHPPVEAAHPVFLHESFSVTESADVGEIQLDPPMWLRGRVAGADGEGVEGVRVEFHSLTGATLPEDRAYPHALRVLGSALTDEGGHYDLLIPAE